MGFGKFSKGAGHNPGDESRAAVNRAPLSSRGSRPGRKSVGPSESTTSSTRSGLVGRYVKSGPR